jgi:hypothetical protein
MIADLKEFPSFFASVVVGLVRAAITEIEVLLIVLLAIAIGFATGPLWGVIAFLGIYVTFRMISQIVGLFAQKIDIMIRMKHNE